MPHADLDRLRGIKTLPQLTAYLRDELDWPIEAGDAEDITFDYEPSELGIDEKAAVRIKEIKQLRPLTGSQPWGIFWVNFEKKRLPVVVMRLILRALVLKKRDSANPAERQAWQPSDLLFISAYGEDTDRAITFAHFVENPGNHLAELRVLGWDDDDTPLHMDYVAGVLHEKLRWDDKLTANPDAWRDKWSGAFRFQHRYVVKTSQDFAAALAQLARNLRTRIRTVLRSEDGFGEIRKLQRAFQTALIHDLDDEGFADMFAQTVTYGLFSVSVRRTFPGEGTAVTKDDVPNLIFTSPFLKEMLGIFLGIKSRKGKIDFDELGVSDVTDFLERTDMELVLRDFNNKTRGEDPVIHFYEHFLSAYNKQLKIQRGVFYTPQPVVSYIVRSVHELLQTEFGLADGLADTTTWGAMLKKHPGLKLPPLTDEPGEKRTISPDEPFVQILDPATGTATFLVEVIDVIHKHLEAKWKANRTALPSFSSFIPQPSSFGTYWNQYVPAHLLPRLHAFELMMAPYAIAHMKIGLKLAETGYRFGTEERARIYLTNALEPWVKNPKFPEFEALAHEAEAVNKIKRDKRFTVVIGNPPYSGHSSNTGEWISRLVGDYYFVDGSPLGERNPKWLQDDYVKFIRFGQCCISQTGIGLQSYITNHGYIDNPTFRGMRQCLLRSFDAIDLLDLHGNSTKKECAPGGGEDVNVFDIKQGVAIFSARKTSDANGSAVVRHAHLFGTREHKYQVLTKSSFLTQPLKLARPASSFYLLIPQDTDLREEFGGFVPISEVMPINVLGFQTHRDEVAVAFDEQSLKQQVTDFLGNQPKKEDWQAYCADCSYRLFDIRTVYLSPKCAIALGENS